MSECLNWIASYVIAIACVVGAFIFGYFVALKQKIG